MKTMTTITVLCLTLSFYTSYKEDTQKEDIKRQYIKSTDGQIFIVEKKIKDTLYISKIN